MTHIYILKDDYAPDAGSRIYGVYTTREKAEDAYEYYSNDNITYGKGCDSLSITCISVD